MFSFAGPERVHTKGVEEGGARTMYNHTCADCRKLLEAQFPFEATLKVFQIRLARCWECGKRPQFPEHP